jgi:hypothetical protein
VIPNEDGPTAPRCPISRPCFCGPRSPTDVAIATVSQKAGFFVTPQKAGWELNLAILGLVVALLVMGPGRWSLDAALGMTRR